MFYRIIAAVSITACVVGTSPGEALAQERYLEIAARFSRAHVYHQALIVPDGDGRNALVSFRIPNSLLVFTQEKDGFLADVELTAELYRDGKKVGEQIWRSRHGAATFDETRSSTDDLEGHVRFEIEAGDYTYRLTLNDDGGDRGTVRAFHVPADDMALIGTLEFGVLSSDSNQVALEAANLGGDVPFGVDLPAIVPVAANPEAAPEETVLTYQLYRLSANRKERNDRRSSQRRSRNGAPSASLPEPLQIESDDDLIESGSVTAGDLVHVGDFLFSDAACTCWANQLSPRSGAGLAAIPLRTDQLENATYVLQVEAGGKVTRYVFGTVWRDMPLSLYDPAVAIRNLEFIEKRDTIREMLGGNRDEQVDAFRAYWKKRDPTPGTVHNELMEEYYRRVDEAAEKFRTGQHPVPDGLRTDPARIYVLYGEPDRITNTLPSSGGVEQTWQYADGRTFLFWAASSLAPMELLEGK